MPAAMGPSMDAVVSVASRMNSLEDIIRQQEQVLSMALQRMREVESVVGTQSRLLEQVQQHIAAMSSQNNSRGDNDEKLQMYVQRQSDQLNALQAHIQEQMATVQGLDAKYDAVTRGMEQKIQSDVMGCMQRMGGLESSTTEAIRSLQGTLNQQMGAIQNTDGKARDEIHQIQGEVQATLAGMRQQEHQLENTMREALRDVHGKLSHEMQEYVSQLQLALRDAITERNEAIASLNQRISQEVASISNTGSGEISIIRQRLEDIDASAREGLRTAYTGLAAELASVAQHSQGVDNRQKLAHQSILQELSKHDAQMETIDVNWRASLVDLNAKLDERLGVIQSDRQTAARTFQVQISGVQDRFAATIDAINAQVNDLAQRVHDRCVVSIESMRVEAARQGERYNKLQEEHATTQEYLKKFALDVDRNASQFRGVVESAIRTAHSDLLDRVNAVAAAVAARQEPNEVQQLINNAVAKMWNDANGAFVTQRDVSGIQSQLASLESAVRQEICALAGEDADLAKRIDQIEVPMRVVELPSGEIIMLPRAGKGVERMSSPVAAPAAPAAPPPAPPPAPVAAPSSPSLTDDRARLTTVEAEAVLADAANFARAAEAAQEVSVQVANEIREYAEEIKRMHAELEALSLTKSIQPVESEAADETLDVPPPVEDDPSGSMEYDGDHSAVAPEPSSPEEQRDARRERYERREKNRKSKRAKQPAPLMPAHAYVLKKEYNNFKDFAKEEIDALWIEVLDLNRRHFVTREEMKAQMSAMKKQMLHHVMNVIHNQESELLGMLSGIKLQLRQLTENPALMTDVALFRAPNGVVDFDRVAEHLNSPPGSRQRRRPSRFDDGAEAGERRGKLFEDSRKTSTYHLAPLKNPQPSGRRSKQEEDSGEIEDVYYVDPNSHGSKRPSRSAEGRPSVEMRRIPRSHEVSRVTSDGHPYAVSPTYSSNSA